ncbi:hypothetical protein PDE_02016 [Penicillium oxalicum 114-2]|uniref:Uncharacterized protein n=1 Tax=Penicillium oxalicum (strain 114-2 / CGMCC 5302) TaxID=933388 RepID=S7Z8Z0_PENO1|nr:hypothetical protein PDE_02016 [Penicillium oxalicum 114-2]
MDLSLDDTATSCDSLRTRYKRAVTDLLRSLKSDPKLNYSSNDLMELNVNLGMFNPEDPDFVASHVCLFKPMPSDEFEKFTFDLSKASRDTRGSHDEYDKRYFEISEDVTEGRCQPDREEVFAMSQDAERTAQYLNIRYEYSRTKTSRFKTLAIISGWTQMDIENSFSKLPEGFLSGFQRCQQIPDWDIRADYEWQDKKTIYPHVMLVMRTGAVAVEGKLFLGELGSIAQVIKNRLAQKEFVTTSLFPVRSVKIYLQNLRSYKAVNANVFPNEFELYRSL